MTYPGRFYLFQINQDSLLSSLEWRVPKTWKNQKQIYSWRNSCLWTVKRDESETFWVVAKHLETNWLKIKSHFMPLFTCRLEMPAAVMTPNMMRNIPPITGVGMVVKMAPILPSSPIKIMNTPLRRITIRLPTCCHAGSLNYESSVDLLCSSTPKPGLWNHAV